MGLFYKKRSGKTVAVYDIIITGGGIMRKRSILFLFFALLIISSQVYAFPKDCASYYSKGDYFQFSNDEFCSSITSNLELMGVHPIKTELSRITSRYYRQSILFWKVLDDAEIEIIPDDNKNIKEIHVTWRQETLNPEDMTEDGIRALYAVYKLLADPEDEDLSFSDLTQLIFENQYPAINHWINYCYKHFENSSWMVGSYYEKIETSGKYFILVSFLP